MSNFDTNTALVIAMISAFSAIVGGLISSGVNLLIEWQRSKIENKKRKEDREAQDLKLRNEAYIKFLEIKDQDAQEVSNQGGHKVYLKFDEEKIKLQIALILTYGSEHLKNSLADSLPLKNWLDVIKIKELIIDELAEGRSHEKKKSSESQRVSTVIIDAH